MAIPVTLEDARLQLRMEPDDDTRDTEIAGFVDDAAGWIERYTGHILVARDVTETFRGFGPVMLKAWPIKLDAVPGVGYIDAQGVPVALTGAILDLSRGRARVVPAGGCFWPFRDALQSFTVTIRAGYEPADPVPRDLRRAMLILIAAYDGDREGGDTFAKAEKAARGLCGDYRGNRL